MTWRTFLSLILVMVGLTGLNVTLRGAQDVYACTCYRSDGTPKCSGDCCGGPGDACDCYDVGTDNCCAARRCL